MSDWWCRHLAKWTKYTRRFCFLAYSLHCENMMSFTKPEVHNVLHCCRRRTEPQQRITCRLYRKFGEICLYGFWDMRAWQTDRHTDITLIALLRTPTRGGAKSVENRLCSRIASPWRQTLKNTKVYDEKDLLLFIIKSYTKYKYDINHKKSHIKRYK